MSRTIAPNSSQARLILIGTALLLMLGVGIRQSLGLSLTPVTRDLGISAADFTLALATQNIGGASRKHWSAPSPTASAFASQ